MHLLFKNAKRLLNNRFTSVIINQTIGDPVSEQHLMEWMWITRDCPLFVDVTFYVYFYLFLFFLNEQILGNAWSTTGQWNAAVADQQ